MALQRLANTPPSSCLVQLPIFLVTRLLPSWLRREEDGDSIKERLREALAQHKDASEADHVRESEERTKQELADVKRELAAMAATQQIILTKLQTILDDKQPS